MSMQNLPPCPKCGAQLQRGDRLCTACGVDLQKAFATSVHTAPAKTGRTPRPSGAASVGGADSLIPAIIAGSIAAAIAAVIWGGIIAFTGFEVGFVAIGVGFATGASVAALTRERTGRIAALACALAIGGILLGKILGFSWIDPHDYHDELAEFVNNDEMMVMSILYYMAENGELSTEEQALYDADEHKMLTPEEEATAQAVANRAMAKLQSMSRDDKFDLAAEIAGVGIEQMSFIEKLQTSFGAYDILWIVLALASAYRAVLGKD